MMTKRILTILTTLAVGAASGGSAVAQSGYMPAPDASVVRDRNYPPGGYRADDPRLGANAPDDADDEPLPGRPPAYSDRIAPPASIGPSEDPRYARPYGGPPNSDRGYAERAPQGPILSPDDPRYGRPAGPPAVIYSDRGYPERPNELPQFNDRRYDDPYGRAMRPPEAVTGSVAPGVAPRQEGQPIQLSALPPEERPEVGPAQLEPRLRRQEVNFPTKEPAGTIVVDTPNTYLYYVLGNGRAVRYGVRVGRDGFTWTGVQKISRKAEWPDWHPPTEMIERQPYLPRFMAGGEGNPLGARAMYLGSTVYRIHGTNQPSTIGKFVSSGCIGMLNDDVSDLFERTKVGTRVVVMPGGQGAATASAQPAPYSPAQANAAPQSYSVPGTQPSSVQPLPPPTNIR